MRLMLPGSSVVSTALGAAVVGIAASVAIAQDQGLPLPPSVTSRVKQPAGDAKGTGRTVRLRRLDPDPTDAGRTPAPPAAPTDGTAPPAMGRTERSRGEETIGLNGVLKGKTAKPPNGPPLGPRLGSIENEDDLLLEGHHAAVRAVADPQAGFDASREPLIMIHGISGDPRDLQPIVDRYKTSKSFQIYVLCYDDWNRRTSVNGVDLADELRVLSRDVLKTVRPISIIGHSMGGIVARRALNELALGPKRGLERFSQVRFIAVDSPWHGYDGPSDRGGGGFLMGFVRPFMPDGLEDMRALSNMFRGDPDSTNPAARAALNDVILPGNVEIDVVFSRDGTEVNDYNKGNLRELAPKLAAYYTDETPVRGDAQLMNFWHALIASKQYYAFQDEMRALGDERWLDVAKVRDALARTWVEYPGAHTGMLKDKAFLDHLEAELGR